MRLTNRTVGDGKCNTLNNLDKTYQKSSNAKKQKQKTKDQIKNNEIKMHKFKAII